MGGGPDKEHLLIIVDLPRPDSTLAKLRQKFPNVEVTYVQTEQGKPKGDVDLQALYKTATILATFRGLPDRAEDVPNLKFVHFFSAGIDSVISHPLYTDSTIPLTTSSGIHGPPIAEWTISHTLGLSRHIFTTHDWQVHRQWGGPSGADGRKFQASISDWVGKRVGIAGYGSIGRQVARVFVAVGAQVVAYTASPRPTPDSRRDKGYIVPGTGDPDGSFPSEWYSGTSKDSLHTFLRAGLDALVISLPLTPATTNLVGKEEFDILRAANPAGTLLVNISRGKIVNQPDLVAALNNGVLSGAALDVTEPEPLPKDDPLWDAKNVVITPHISGSGREYFGRAYDVLIANLGRLARGQELVNETILAAVALSAAFLGARRVYVNYFRRVPEARDISRAWLQKRSLLGTVTSVGDGDNFRVYHTPGGRLVGWGWLPGRRVPTEKAQLKRKTIHVRIAGIDAPELAHFGKPAQPYGQEALDWLTSYVLHRRVRVYVHQADQYQRVVATAYVWRFFIRRDVGLEMLRAGLATVYEAKTGVIFGPGLEPKYRKAEAWAKSKRRGLWSIKGKHLETPREYKARHASPPPLPPSFFWESNTVSHNARAYIKYKLVARVDSGALFKNHKLELAILVTRFSPDPLSRPQILTHEYRPSPQWSSSALRVQSHTLKQKFRRMTSNQPELKTACIAFRAYVFFPARLSLQQHAPIAFSIKPFRITPNDPEAPQLCLDSLALTLKSHTAMVASASSRRSTDRFAESKELETSRIIRFNRVVLPLDGTKVMLRDDVCLAKWRPGEGWIGSFSTYTITRDYGMEVDAVVRHTETGHVFSLKTEFPFCVLDPHLEGRPDGPSPWASIKHLIGEMPSAATPAVVVARFLKANNYTQTLEAFLQEAGLSESSITLDTNDWTIEKILDEKRQLDASQAYEKKPGGDDDDSNVGWTTPAPTVPHAPLTAATSNVLCVRGDPSSTRILTATADRKVSVLSAQPSSSYETISTISDNDSPVLSLTLVDGYCLTTSMSGELTLRHGDNYSSIVDRVRDHTKYAVASAVLRDGDGDDSNSNNNSIIIATAGWDKKAVVFVRNPATKTAYLILSRRDSTYLYYYSVVSRKHQQEHEQAQQQYTITECHPPQNLAPHNPSSSSFTPSSLALHPCDPTLLAVATSHLPHLHLIIARLLFPDHPDRRGPGPGRSDPVAIERQKQQAKEKEEAAVVVHATTMAPQTLYSTPAVVWRPNGTGVFVNGDDGAVRGLEAKTGKAGSKVRTLWCGVLDGCEVLLSGGFDKKLVVWECM
ncbi:hypothetical protein DV736_g5152, partial [Chaetothyriales sp. CBS 134916]